MGSSKVLNMGNYFFAEQEFVNKINEFFTDFSKDIKALQEERNAALAKAKAEVDSFGAGMIKKKVDTFTKHKKSIEEFLQKLEETKITPSLLKISYKPESFPSIEKAIEEMNSRFEVFSKQLKEFNEYKFSDTTVGFSFDGENAVVNGQTYQAPEFPDLNESDFDTDENYKALIKNLYLAAYAVLSCLDFALSYFSKEDYGKVIDGIKKTVMKQAEDELNKETEDKFNERTDSAKTFYRNECLPVLEKSDRDIHDYQTARDFEMPDGFSEKINLGRCELNVSNYPEFKDSLKEIDTQKIIKSKLEFPVYLDLINKGNVLIQYSAKNQIKGDTTLSDFVHQLILQFISSAPYKKVSLALIDIDSFDEFDFMKSFSKSYLTDNHLLFNGNIATDEASFRDMLDGLLKKINEVKGQKLGPKDCDNVFQYNSMSPENTQELHLFVYVDCPKRMNSDVAEKISNLVVNGNECCIYSIIINDESEVLSTESYQYNQNEHQDFINRISEHSLVIDYSTDAMSFTIDSRKFIPNLAFKASDVSPFFEKLSQGAKESASNNIIYLDTILNQQFPRSEYYKELKIPVGKDGGDLVFFKLDIEGTGTSSAVIAGGTGSGKSSFLHNIILSGASYYSPEELEFYLIDFKDGVEFSPYYNPQTRTSVIPHISFLSLNNKVEDAHDILQKIYKEKEYRNVCFKKVDAQNITTYSQHPDVKSGKLPRFKRLIVIIDEYQNFLTSSNTSTSILCGKCAALLLSLLKEIRNVGISLILSSQKIDIERDSLEQINNRYIMSSSGSTLQTAFPDFIGDDMNVELSKEKGLVYKTENGGHKKQLFKAAYGGKIGESRAEKIIASINEKWKAKPNYPAISGSEDPLMVYASNAPFATFTNIYSEEDIDIKVFFGQSALSDDLINISFTDSEACSFALIGSLKKTRPIEASIGLSFLYSLKCMEYEIDRDCVHYLELNNTDTARKFPSPFELYNDELSQFVTYSCEVDEIANSINSLYEEYLQRKESGRQRRGAIKVPRLLIINSYYFLEEISEDYSNQSSGGVSEDPISYDESSYDPDAMLAQMAAGDAPSSSGYDSGLSLAEKVKILYQNGFSYKIYVVIQDTRTSNITKGDDFVDLKKSICCDEKEMENCSDIPINNLPETYAVLLYPDISKVKPFIYDKTPETKKFINDFVKELNK